MSASPKYFSNRAAKSYVPPASLEEGERRRLELVDRLSEVNIQLGDRNKMTIDGRRVTSDEYWGWRQRAVIAKRYAEAELQHLKSWMKEQRRARTADQARSLDIDPTSPESLLLAAANVFQRLRSDGVEVDPEEVAVFDAIKDYLQHGPCASREPPEER